MKIATSDTAHSESDFRYRFVTDVEFMGVLSDFASETRIEIDREGDQEEIAFRTQGEGLRSGQRQREKSLR